jgi:RNA 2',3'-cyclic 3'-phosphodiesterase
MSLLRAFIAIEIPPEIKKTISAQTANLQKDSASSVRWVASENIHLTFKFLGEISAANVEILAQALKTECEQCHPFEITVEELGCFPNSRRPRVLWVGLVVPQELNRLQRQIEAVTSRLGYATEEKPFSPHLTIGRVREQASSAELQALHTLLEQTRIATLGTFTVREVHLFKSDLKPSGPVYTRLSTALLK